MANTITEELQLIATADTAQAERAVKQLQLDLAKLKGAQTDEIVALEGEVAAYDELIANMKISSENYQIHAESASAAAKASQEVTKSVQETAEVQQKQQPVTIESTISYKRLGLELLKVAGIGGGIIGLFRTITSAAINMNKEQQALMDSLDQSQAKLLLSGNAYEVSMSQIDSWATMFRSSLNITKNDALSAATSLITITDVSSDLFDQIANIGTGLSLIFGDDVTASIDLIANALKNPADGISLLEQKGIRLDATTRKTIATLLQQNRVYEAQVQILNGLANKLDDVAAATGINSTASNAEPSKDLLLSARMQVHSVYQDSENMMEDLRKLSIETLELAIKYYKESVSTILKNDYGSFQTGEEYLNVLNQIVISKKQSQELDKLAAEEAAKKMAAEATYLALIEKEIDKTTSLQDLYAITSQGQTRALENQLRELKEQQEKDLLTVRFANDPEADQNVVAQARARLSLYEPVIQQLTEDLEALYGVASETLFERIFGSKTASDYVMDIPISFIFGQGDQTRARLEAELATLKSIINELWTSSPAEDEIEKWQSELNIVIAKYDEIVSELEGINYLDGLRTEAERLLLTLLSDEEIKQMELNDLSERLLEMVKEGLITEDQRLAILQKQTTEVSNQVDRMEELKESLKEMLISSGAQGLSSLFVDFGDALGSGVNLLDALGDSLGDTVSQMTKQISSMAMMAGLRIIAESGVSGLPIALGLFALGGATGLVGGFFGASGKGVDTAVLEGMEEEVKARQALTKELQKSLDTEFELLKRQLDRNLISQEDFRSGAADLYRQQLLGEAKNALGSNAMGQIANLNTDLVSMSGWTKFWTKKDENLGSQIAQIEALFYAIDQITNAEELNKMIAQLAALGVSVGDIPRFARGGDFVTDGPQLIMVGDNLGGKERVQITPLGSAGSATSGETFIIQINAPVYGVEDLYGKLQEAGRKLGRRGIA